VVIEDITSSDVVVTSLTIQPLTGLRFGATYELVLDPGIEDLDPTPKSLVPYTTKFTTFGPDGVGGTADNFLSAGIAVLGNRAYVVQNNFSNGILRAYDISNPVAPVEIPSAQAYVTWRPVDIVAEEESTISAGRLVVIATSTTNQSKPSNLYLFDVSSDGKSRWIGATSVTNSAVDGFINRIKLRSPYVYSATHRKGLQVVDLQQSAAVFPGEFDFRMRLAFNSDGQGFGQEAVVQTIPVEDPNNGLPEYITDLEVGDFVLDGQSQPLIVAVGRGSALIVANPQTGQLVTQTSLQKGSDTLVQGWAVELGQLGNRQVALVGGFGTIGGQNTFGLAIVSLDDPRNPVTLGMVAISGVGGFFTDLVLRDGLALLSHAIGGMMTIVNVADPMQPRVAGTVSGVGARMALTSDNLLLSTARGVFQGHRPARRRARGDPPKAPDAPDRVPAAADLVRRGTQSHARRARDLLSDRAGRRAGPGAPRGRPAGHGADPGAHRAVRRCPGRDGLAGGIARPADAAVLRAGHCGRRDARRAHLGEDPAARGGHRREHRPREEVHRGHAGGRDLADREHVGSEGHGASSRHQRLQLQELDAHVHQDDLAG
jgi:hypothetical protein